MFAQGDNTDHTFKEVFGKVDMGEIANHFKAKLTDKCYVSQIRSI